MKKILIVMGAFAVALMITLSGYAACPCATAKPCCETPKPCCEAPVPCCQEPETACKCGCYSDVINTDKACDRTSFDVIAHSRKLSKFERIIKQACMEDYFECGNYVALVPMNCALKGVKFKCPDAAKKLVLDHLADAKCYPDCLCKYPSVKTLCGKEFCITNECGKMKIGNANVVCIAKTKNGIIYVIDRKLK